MPSIEKDPSIHPNSTKNSSLSPNARLRFLKAQIEAKFKDEISDKAASLVDNSIEFIGT